MLVAASSIVLATASETKFCSKVEARLAAGSRVRDLLHEHRDVHRAARRLSRRPLHTRLGLLGEAPTARRSVRLAGRAARNLRYEDHLSRPLIVGELLANVVDDLPFGRRAPLSECHDRGRSRPARRPIPMTSVLGGCHDGVGENRCLDFLDKNTFSYPPVFTTSLPTTNVRLRCHRARWLLGHPAPSTGPRQWSARPLVCGIV